MATHFVDAMFRASPELEEIDDNGLPLTVGPVDVEKLRAVLLPTWMAYEKTLRAVAIEIQQGGETARRAVLNFERRLEETIEQAADKVFPLTNVSARNNAVIRTRALLMFLYDGSKRAELTKVGVNPHRPGGNPVFLKRLVDVASWFPLNEEQQLPRGTMEHVVTRTTESSRPRSMDRPTSGPRQFALSLKRPAEPRAVPAATPSRRVIPQEQRLPPRRWSSLPPLRPVSAHLMQHVGKRIGRLTVKGLWVEGDDLWIVKCACGSYETRHGSAITGCAHCDGRCRNCAGQPYRRMMR